MNKCYECGKNLKFWEGFIHPIIGGKKYVCSDCYDTLDQRMKKYRGTIIREINKEKNITIKNNSAIKFRNMVH